jgi:hypothetical protein
MWCPPWVGPRCTAPAATRGSFFLHSVIESLHREVGRFPSPLKLRGNRAENPLTRIRHIRCDLSSHIEMMASLLVSDREIKYFLPSIWETALPGKESQVTSDLSVMVAAI